MYPAGKKTKSYMYVESQSLSDDLYLIWETESIYFSDDDSIGSTYIYEWRLRAVPGTKVLLTTTVVDEHVIRGETEKYIKTPMTVRQWWFCTKYRKLGAMWWI